MTPNLSLIDPAFVGAATGAAVSTELWSVTGTGQNDATGASIVILAQRFQTGQVLVDEAKTITRFDVNLKRVGSPTNVVTGRMIDGSNAELLNMGTLEVSTLDETYTTKTFENLAGHVLTDGDRLALFYSDSYDSNYIDWQMNTSSANPLITNGSYYSADSSTWTERGRDATMSVWGY